MKTGELLEDAGVDKRIILKLLLQKFDAEALNGFIGYGPKVSHIIMIDTETVRHA
jgi:hypothetical protein